MSKPIEEHVRPVLAKNGRAEKIRTALVHGWENRKSHPGNEQWRRKTTRAHIVWERAVDQLIDLLADDPGVRVEEHYDTVSFIFDDAVLLRIKKAGVTLRSGNVHTLLSDLFDDHDTDLFGYNGLQRVEGCYVLNRFETGLLWTGIVARDHGNPLWHFEIGSTGAAVAETTVLPFRKPEKEPARSLAKLRGHDAKPEENKNKKDSE